MIFFKKKPTLDRANRLLAAGKVQEAIDMCQRICRQVPGATPREWLLYGCLSADSGDLVTAREALGKTIELDPGLSEARFGLGKVLAAMGDYPAALDCLREAADLQPENPEIWLTMGIASGLTQDMPGAEEYCRRALELQPESADARFNLANALQAQGNLDEAEAEYEAALKLVPEMAGGWSMLAQARVGLRKFAEAKVAATRALRLDPRMGEAHFTLGNIEDALGDRERARDCFSQAAELLPNFPDARMRLGQVLFGLKKYAEAAESLQAAVNLDPGIVEAHFMMGQCFQELKLHSKAENCYQQALALSNDHLKTHYSLAFMYMGMDRHAESAKHFAEVLRINPDDDQARHLLAAQQGETTATAPVAYVATLFDGFADTFDAKLVDELGYHIPELLHDMVSQHTAPASGSLDIIDLGCGTGLCAPLFRDMGRTLCGIDLSSRMIEKARERALYDTLEVGDIVSSLVSREAAWDLAISADVFVYVGDLQEIFAACASALRPGGIFAFSIEAGDDADTFVLRETGRYAHASAYIRALAAETGFAEIERRAVIVRKDKGQVDVNGYIFLLRRTTDGS
jgi:predicted TPR repeat methyltransferase